MIKDENNQESNIYSEAKRLLMAALGREVYSVLTEDVHSNTEKLDSSFQKDIENRICQLIRKHKQIRFYNNLIGPYGHKYYMGDPTISSDEQCNIREVIYCIAAICLYKWDKNRISTNQAIEYMIKAIDYLEDPPDAEPEKERCKKLYEQIDHLFYSTELPFVPGRSYGRFFMTLPEYSKINISYNSNLDMHQFKKARVIFLMVYFEIHGSMRLRYARECERIRSSVFFRYSQYKAQVMFNSASDEQRTRLSHSLEVAGIAKSIATQLDCNWELTEAMALGHDLGHVPFGHQGEEQLDTCLQKAWAGRFSHSLQSIKVLDDLAIHSALFEKFGITGLCLSRPVLEGILKHDTDNLLHDIRRAGWRLQFNGWRETLVRYNNCGVLEEPEWENGTTLGGLESQIMYWSDKIAYAGHDWDELIQSGYIDQITMTLDNMLKRMHQIRHMIGGRVGLIRQKINFSDITNETQIIRFVRYIIEEIRQAFVIEYKEPVDLQDDIMDSGKAFLNEEVAEKRIVMALHPWEEENSKDESAPIIRYKDYPLHHLICGLKSIIEKIDKNAITLSYFTKNEYQMLLDFFSVVYNWIKITGVYPKPYKKSDDVLWVLCRYLTKIDNRTVVHALKMHIIHNSRKNINSVSNFDEKGIIEKLGKEFKEKKNAAYESDLIRLETLEEARDYVSRLGYIGSSNESKYRPEIKKIKKWFKKNMQKQMLITMEDGMISALDVTGEFVRSYYIESPRVRAMKTKAYMIIEKLFNFFMEHEDMLPIDYQQRIEFDTPKLSRTEYKVKGANEGKDPHKLVFQYLQERYIEHLRQDERYATENQKMPAACLLPAIKSDFKDSLPKEMEAIIDEWIKEKSIQKGGHDNIYLKLCRYISKARVVADYIACMTDRYAEKKYNEIVSSSTFWSTSFHE